MFADVVDAVRWDESRVVDGTLRRLFEFENGLPLERQAKATSETLNMDECSEASDDEVKAGFERNIERRQMLLLFCLFKDAS